MAQQTAVEWLIKKLQNRQNGIFDGLPHLSLDEIYNQAKQMEKEQHSNTWTDARTHHKEDDYIGKEISFEQYYNETYMTNNKTNNK